MKKGLVSTQDFYGYVARKIRDLCKLFNIERIAMDSQGGGIAILEALHDPDKMLEGEVAFWPVINYDEPKDTDDMPGEHLIELINFAKAEWVQQANHGLKKDLEDKALLFPEFDAVSLGLAMAEDVAAGRVQATPEGGERLYDTLEENNEEIRELIDELATIVFTQTPNGRDHWDTPETKLPGQKRGKMRKDRYSALLMANMIARTLQRAPKNIPQEVYGGFSHELVSRAGKPASKQVHQNPAWYTEKMGKNFGAAVRHG